MYHELITKGKYLFRNYQQVNFSILKPDNGIRMGVECTLILC